MKENKTSALLVKLRKGNNYTQNDLAEKLGISYQAVSKWERGENLPDAHLLLEIADLYKITVDEILRGQLIVKEEIEDSNSRKKKFAMIIAIVLLIISPISIFVFGVDNSEIYVTIILSVAAISIAMLLYVSFSTKELSRRLDISVEEKRQHDMVYAVCMGVFLILGLAFTLWYVAWVVFIFGYVVVLYLGK